MPRRLLSVLLALAVSLLLAGCSGAHGGGSSAPDGGPLRFTALARPPTPIGPADDIAGNDDALVALADGRMFRFDPWTPGAIWLELGRDLPSARSQIVSWNDRVWYLTTDRGRLELASVALSGDQRADTRAVSGATDANFAIMAARDALYVFGTEGGFRVDRDGVYSEFAGPPDRTEVPDWSKAQVAQLGDGSIVVADGARLRWIYEPDISRWRAPADDLQPKDTTSIAVANDGLYFVSGSPLQVQRMVASNRVESVSASLGANCDSLELYPSDVGVVSVGCGKAMLFDGTTTRTTNVPAGTSVAPGPRGRPLALRSDTGELWLLQLTQ